MSRPILYDRTDILTILVGIMSRPRRSFDPVAFYPLFDKNIITKIEAEGDAKAASDRRLVQKLKYNRMRGLMKSGSAMS